MDGRRTLLGETIARLQPLIPRDRIFVIAAAQRAVQFRRALRGVIPARNLILEPQGRGTAVAIAYGIGVIEARIGPGVVAVMPSDHYVSPAGEFRRTLRQAIKIAGRHAAIVMIGIRPTRAEPGYGYQQIGSAVDDGAYEVEAFVEKPAPARAAEMVRGGGFLWNAGMFIMRTPMLAAEIAKNCPRLEPAMRELPSLRGAKLAAAYNDLNFDSFDREIVEKSGRVISVQADFRWHDVGSWQGLWEALKDRSGNVLTGPVVMIDSEAVVARAGDRPMVLLGMKDVVAIDAGDAILIAQRSHSQELRRVVDELRGRGLQRLL